MTAVKTVKKKKKGISIKVRAPKAVTPVRQGHGPQGDVLIYGLIALALCAVVCVGGAVYERYRQD